MIATSTGCPLDCVALQKYFDALVNQFFKILPIREQEEDSLATYVHSLQLELIGCRDLVLSIHHDPAFLTLLSILQYFSDNPSCPVGDVRREVFRAISICNKLSARYAAK